MSKEKTKEEWKEFSNNLNNMSQKARDNFGKGDYESIQEDIEDFRSSYSTKDKAISGSKIAGKSLLNIGKFTLGKVVPEILNTMSKKANDKTK